MSRRGSLPTRADTFRRRIRALVRDRKAVTAVEFAIVAPVMGMMLLGAFDIGHTLYMRAVLQGIVQKVARDAALETGADASQDTTLDNEVIAQVSAIANNANITITRRYYRSFTLAAAATPESFTDTNHDGTCDNGEPYVDANLNGVWDKDGGNGGQGGADDAVLYTVSLSYPRLFPIQHFIGGSSTTKISAATVLENQPYTSQGSYGTPVVRNCT